MSSEKSQDSKIDDFQLKDNENDRISDLLDFEEQGSSGAGSIDSWTDFFPKKETVKARKASSKLNFSRNRRIHGNSEIMALKAAVRNSFELQPNGPGLDSVIDILVAERNFEMYSIARYLYYRSKSDFAEAPDRKTRKFLEFYQRMHPESV